MENSKGVQRGEHSLVEKHINLYTAINTWCINMQPKTLVIEDKITEIEAAIAKLSAEGYRRIELHFFGSKLHEQKHIDKNFVLIRAFKR